MAFGVNIVPLTRPRPPKRETSSVACDLKFGTIHRNPTENELRQAKELEPFTSLLNEFRLSSSAMFNYQMPADTSVSQFAAAQNNTPASYSDLFPAMNDAVMVAAADQNASRPSEVYSFMDFIRDTHCEFLLNGSKQDGTSSESTTEGFGPLPELDPSVLAQPLDEASLAFLQKKVEEMDQLFWGMSYEEYKAQQAEQASATSFK